VVTHDKEPGIVFHEAGRLKITVDDGYIYIKELQAPGKKRIPAGDFLRGFHQNILSAG
jgi:methionyl-tRNA formyltransferase